TMAVNLRRINPTVQVDAHVLRLDPDGICELFAETHVVAECFDKADQKQMIVETVLSRMTQPIVSGSGLAGYGDSNTIRTERLNPRWVMVGDRENDVNLGLPLTAGRVWIAAAHQANAIVSLLVDEVL
ncbi:ThiF family adenylyltransferase, partial [Planctomycetota bacterium]